jgi:hypothetical protein
MTIDCLQADLLTLFGNSILLTSTPFLLLVFVAYYPCRLHQSGQRWVPIIDCGIPVAHDDLAYQEGIAAGVFIKDLSGKPYLGQVSQMYDKRVRDMCLFVSK